MGEMSLFASWRMCTDQRLQAMRLLHNYPMGAGAIYELHNLKAYCYRLPAYLIIALLYGELQLFAHTCQRHCSSPIDYA